MTLPHTAAPPSNITLYGFPRSWGLPNMSPYCMKVETYLRLAGVEHRRAVGDLRVAPRGQMPYALVDDATIGDSDAIIDAVIRKTGVDLDRGLSAARRAEHRCLARMLEESTVWVLRYGRFIDSGYEDLRDFMDAILPAGARLLLRPMIRRAMRQALQAQGLGRYSRDEIYAFGRRDLDAVADLLGDRPFFGGDSPTRVDCTVFAFTASFLCEHARSPMTDHVSSRPTLVRYTERMRARAFPELPSWVGARVGAPIDEVKAA